MAVDYSKFNFSQPSTDTAQSGATTPEVAQQQATSPLPSLEPKYVSLNPEDFQSPDQFAIAQRELEKQADKDYEQRVAEFIPLANQRYGINPELGKNNLNYRQLNAQLDKDGVTSTQRYEIQQQWIKSAEKFRDSLPDGDRKTQLTQQIEQIKEIPMTVQEGSIPNRIAESWRQNSPAMEAQAERFANAATHRITMTDTDILKKYDPELLEEVEKAGGIAYIRNIGAGSNIDPNEDVLGVGGMLKFGTTEKERELGKRMLEKLENYRAKETLSRTDLNGEEVTLPDGRKVKMSNQQAAEYYANQGSSIKGRNEWLKYFEEHPFSSLKSVDGILNFFQSGLDSSIRQAPLMVAGTAAMFFNPTAGLAIMNSGNISDQELAAVNKAATDEYKKLHGKDADITKLPAQEYLNFLQDLADKGIISKASNEGIRTGAFMSTAETLTGGFVDKLGVAALKKMSATELSSKLKTQAAKWALGTAGYGLKISDEGLQELSSTIIENVRTGKKWNDGLTQAFLLGTFSIENASQHLGRGVNKLVEKAKAEKAENDADKANAQPTENAQSAKEKASTEPTQGQAQPTTNADQARPTDTTQPSSANTATQNTPTDVNALLAEWERLGSAVDENGEVSNENALRLDEIEKQIANDTGRSFQSVYGEWKNNGSVASQGNVNENRTDNRTGSENANGQTDGQGTNEPNASGTQRSDETSEPVSQTQTETPTTGDSQSNTQPTADSAQQQNNNSPESDTTGSDGRTTETNSTRGEQGELGQNGSEQSGEPTQATSEGSTDSGVRERTQSDSVGETLVNRKTVARSYNNDVESERNPYSNIADKKGIDEVIAKSRENIAKFKDQGDSDNAKWELDYLRQAYARKEQITGQPQLDNFRAELDKVDPEPVAETPTVTKLSDERLVSNIERERSYLRDKNNYANRDYEQRADRYRELLNEARDRGLAPDADVAKIVKHTTKSARTVGGATRRFETRANERILNGVKRFNDLRQRASRVISQVHDDSATSVKQAQNRLRGAVNNLIEDATIAMVTMPRRMRAKIRSLIARLRDLFSPKRHLDKLAKWKADVGNKVSELQDTIKSYVPKLKSEYNADKEVDNIISKVRNPKIEREDRAEFQRDIENDVANEIDSYENLSWEKQRQRKKLLDAERERLAKLAKERESKREEPKPKHVSADVEQLNATRIKMVNDLVAGKPDPKEFDNVFDVVERMPDGEVKDNLLEQLDYFASWNNAKLDHLEGDKPTTNAQRKSFINTRLHLIETAVNADEARALVDSTPNYVPEAKKKAVAVYEKTFGSFKQNATTESKQDSGRAEQPTETSSPVSDKGTTPNETSDNSTRAKPAKPKRTVKSKRKDSDSAEHVEESGSKNTENVSGDDKDKAFLSADKNTFATKQEMVDVMRDAMSSHLDDKNANAALFEHANNLADQRKGRKGWSAKVKVTPPNNALIDLTPMIANAERKHIEAVTKRSSKGESEVTPSERLQYPKDMTDEDIVAHKERMAKHREQLKEAATKGEPVKPEQTVPAIEKENRINRAIDNAVEQSRPENDPVRQIRETKSVKINGKSYDGNIAKLVKARELMDNGLPFEEAWKAFIEAGGSPQSRSVLERGGWKVPAKKQQRNQIVSEAVEQRGAKAGDIVRFDGSVISKNSIIADISPDLMFEIEDHPIQSQMVEIANHLETDARETADVAIDRTEQETGTSVEAVKAELFKQEPNFFVDENLEPLTKAQDITNEQVVAAANDKSILDKVSDKVKQFLNTLNKAIMSVLAVVAVGSMTIPTDAHAQTGYSVYESGPKVAGVSQKASDTINWVLKNKDHNGKSFVVADKEQGKIHIIGTDGKVLDTQNAIFGKNKGDTVGVGNTPSGRFLLTKMSTDTLSDSDKRLFGDSVLDLRDKETGQKVRNEKGQVVAIHRVLNTPVRKQALISATPNDNFLSQGCINVPTAFYNQAVNDLDGSMVYVLAQEKGSNMSNGTAKSSNVKNAEVKSSNTTRGTTKTTPSRSNMSGVPAASGLGVPAASGLRFSVRPKDIAKVNDRITEKSLMKSLDRTLGKLADKVNFITSDQMQNTKGLEYFTKNGVEGFYDPKTQQVFIVADNIAPAHGLTAEERLAFVAWHEMTHLGLDTKYGKELHRILDLAGDNLFVSDLALAIQRERASRGERTSVSDSMAIEEALAELNAALNTGNVKTLEDRYGVRVPKEFRNDIKHDTDTFFDKVRKLVRKLLGKPNISNAQIREILAGLDENIAKYAAPESREVTARLNEILNDPTSVLGETPRFSVRSTIGSTVRWVDNFIHRLLNPKRPLESPGAEPSAFMGQDIPYQEQTDALNWREKKSEEWADSDMPAIKYMGGAGTKIVQLLKSTKNRVAKNHRKWVRQIEFLNARMKARAKKMAKKGIYKKDQTYRIDTDIQRLNTSLAAITNVFKNGKLEFAAMNKQLIEDYKKRINGYDETDANGNTYRVEGLIEKMTAFGYDFANNTMPDYTPYQRKQLMRLKNEYEKMTRALAKMEASDNLILSTKGLKGLANKQNLTAQQMQDLADAKTLRKDLRMHNGLTTAEAYDTITDLVKTGKIDITYDGKSWLDYIADVGFTPEQGFVDISKDYSIDFDKLQVNGELAALAKDARTLAQEMYQFQEQELGKELSGVSHGHPFFTPTMGESKNLKLWINFDDKNNTIEIPGTQTIDDKISDEEAAEWQSQRLGRAFMGAGTTQNLNLLAEQVSRRAGWKAIGEQMLQDGKDNKYKVRVVPTNDPGFADAKGIVVSEKLKNGATRYVKVSLDDTRANDALFGDNVATVGHLASAKWLGFINRSVATFITATPAFSVWNAYRGLREKHQQIQSWSNKLPQGSAERYFFDSLDKKHQDMLMGFGGLNFSRALAWRTIVNLFKGFTTKGYLRASLVMAQEMGTTRDGGGNWFTKGVRSVLLAGNGAKETYAKLKAVYDAGGITTRSDSNSYSAKELAEIYGKGGVGSKAIKGLEHFQERMLTLTTAFELVSTLSTLDTLESMGMSQEKAIQANLHFMNFNDRGASETSAWIRASVPFANATAQGARSTARSFKTWNGIKAGIRRTAWTVAGLIVSNMLREMFPCEEDLGEASFRDRNDAELMRELPIRIGCDFEIRLPIAYGADMIWHAIGVAGYQRAMGNWNTKQALGAIWHSVLENSSPVPQTPASANSWVENLFAPFIPRPVMVAINLARDKDDFGNKLSARGADEKSQKYKFAKKNTSPFWSGFAEALHTIGIKMTPEQARYAINGWVSPWGVDMVDGFTKPLKEGETRIGRIANAMLGGKTAIRQVRNEGQSSFIKVKNNLSRYASLDEEITNGVENKELKFGSTNANTKSWLKKRIEDGTFKKEDEETVRVILDWRKAQAQINSKQVSPERKEKLYTEANKKYLKAMHAIEDRD